MINACVFACYHMIAHSFTNNKIKILRKLKYVEFCVILEYPASLASLCFQMLARSRFICQCSECVVFFIAFGEIKNGSVKVRTTRF